MNTKLLFTLGAACLFFASCQSKSYKINGSVEGLEDGDTLFLTSDFQMGIPSDTLVVKDGKFTFNGETDSTYLCMVYSDLFNEINTPFFIEPGTITIHLTDRPGGSRVGGTKCNDGWQELNDSVMVIGREINRIAEHIYGRTITREEQEKGMEQIEKLNQRFAGIVVKTTEKNIKNEFGFFLLTYYPEKLINNETRARLIQQLPDDMQQRPIIQSMKKALSHISKTAKGATIPDFSRPTLDGTELNIMSEVRKNKVTLINFWASYCGACRQEMPFLVKMYNNYKDKGFGVVGISTDINKENWERACKQLNMPWPQMCDEKNPKTISSMFNVRKIPHNIVVDSQGKILQRGLRGKALEQFVASQLK